MAALVALLFAFIAHVYPVVIVPMFVVIPVMVALIKKVYHDKTQKVVLIYLIFGGLMNIVERIVGRQNINNLPLLHVYTIIEFLLIARYFQLSLNNKKTGQMIRATTIFFSLFSILNFLCVQDLHGYNTYPRPIAAIIIILLGCYHLSKQLENEQKMAWSLQPENWITIGLLLYFCTSFLYFAFLNVVNDTASDKLYFFLAYLHATLVLLMYLLFAKGFSVHTNER